MTNSLIPLDGIDYSSFAEALAARKLLRFLNIPRFTLIGGYFRDVLHRKSWKDIDIVIPGDSPLREAEGRVYEVQETLVYEKLNIVQLYENYSEQEIFDRVDIGLCQIGLNSEGQLVATNAYLRDMRDKTITQLWAPQCASDEDHFNRVCKKYPEFDPRPYNKREPVYSEGSTDVAF